MWYKSLLEKRVIAQIFKCDKQLYTKNGLLLVNVNVHGNDSYHSFPMETLIHNVICGIISPNRGLTSHDVWLLDQAPKLHGMVDIHGNLAMQGN